MSITPKWTLAPVLATAVGVAGAAGGEGTLAGNVPAAGPVQEQGAGPSNGTALGIQALLHGITGMTRLPVAGLQMVQAGERLLFVSANGRYVFTGPAWDLWHGARLASPGEAARLAGRIDLKHLGLDPGALGALDVGEGTQTVVLFVDPRCPHCRALLRALPALGARYRFRLVPLPVLGPASEQAVARLDCLAERAPQQAREALLSGKVDALPEPTAGCGQARAQRALVTAELLGITGVPYLIAPDGRMQQGAPADLSQWLEGRP
jgi:thiol:disulfide interchange protein DsbC